jgi:hypothetical protein
MLYVIKNSKLPLPLCRIKTLFRPKHEKSNTSIKVFIFPFYPKKSSLTNNFALKTLTKKKKKKKIQNVFYFYITSKH